MRLPQRRPKIVCNTRRATFDINAPPAFIRVCWQGENVVRRKGGKWGFGTEEATRELQAACGNT